MTEHEIEQAAGEILKAHAIKSVPIDPLHIACLEGITLLTGSYDNCFDSRLEYRCSRGQGRFYLFYVSEKESGYTEGRIRFSIAHELGHFYLPEHRKFLLSGHWHGSHVGFVSHKQTEREADLFAAALLMPKDEFVRQVDIKSDHICTFADLETLAANVFRTSLTSTVIRYCNFDFEPCCAVLSENGRVLYSYASYSMMRQGLGYVKKNTAVPATSVTGCLLSENLTAAPKKMEKQGRLYSDVWFERKQTAHMWEEVRILGRTGFMLTFIVLDDH